MPAHSLHLSSNSAQRHVVTLCQCPAALLPPSLWQPATAGGAVCFAHFKFNFWFHLRTVCFSFFRVIVSGCENKLKILLCQLAQRGNNTVRTPVVAGQARPGHRAQSRAERSLGASFLRHVESFLTASRADALLQLVGNLCAHILLMLKIFYIYRNVFFSFLQILAQLFPRPSSVRKSAPPIDVQIFLFMALFAVHLTPPGQVIMATPRDSTRERERFVHELLINQCIVVIVQWWWWRGQARDGAVGGALGWHDGNKLENVANLVVPKQAQNTIKKLRQKRGKKEKNEI